MSQTDRLYGLVAGAAIKIPCITGTTANITLSAEQTIDGVAVVTGDRVLVKNQTDATENGIYAVDTGDWERAKDFDGNNDVVKGTLVYVTDGSTTLGYWRVTTDDPITIDTDDIDWELALVNDAADITFLQAGAGAVARSANSKMRDDYATPEDFGAVGDGVTNDYVAMLAAITAGKPLRLLNGKNYLINTTLSMTSAVAVDIQGPASDGTANGAKITGTANPVISVSGNSAVHRFSGFRVVASAGNTALKVGGTLGVDAVVGWTFDDLDLRGGAIGLDTPNIVQCHFKEIRCLGTSKGWRQEPAGAQVVNTNTTINCQATTGSAGIGLSITGGAANKYNTHINLDCSQNVTGLASDGLNNTFIAQYSENIVTNHIVDTATAESTFINRASVGAGAVSIGALSSDIGSDYSDIVTQSLKGLLDLSAAGAGQIKFPATQNASSNANTLDDYEEGNFTPSNANMTTGNGTNAGSYIKMGKQVRAWNNFVFGSTSAYGGTITAGFPFSASTTKNGFPIGSWEATDASVPGYFIGSCQQVSADGFQCVIGGGVATLINATNPMAWTTSDSLRAQYTYEAAA